MEGKVNSYANKVKSTLTLGMEMKKKNVNDGITIIFSQCSLDITTGKYANMVVTSILSKAINVPEKMCPVYLKFVNKL